MTEKIKVISSPITQLILRHFGMYCSERLSVDLYYLMEAINLMISYVGEDYISKKYKEEGKNWDEIKIKVVVLNKLAIETKGWYDLVQDKKFERKSMDSNLSKTQAMIKKYFKKTASKIALMQRDLYDILIFLIKNTSIQRNSIPNEAFKILEHIGFKKIDMVKKPSGQASSDEVVEEE